MQQHLATFVAHFGYLEIYDNYNWNLFGIMVECQTLLSYC